MNTCGKGITLASGFYDVPIEVVNCSDGVVFICFSFDYVFRHRFTVNGSCASILCFPLTKFNCSANYWLTR
jgi:hypothetical protein